MQLSLFPRQIVSLSEPDEESSCLFGYAEADNGLDYAVKADVAGAPVRATEWLCTVVASDIGIAVPNCAPLVDRSGETYFGSEWLGGISDRAIGLQILNGQLPARDTQAQLSKIFAYDLFIFNEDRNIKNYLFPMVRGSHRIIAFDFDAAFLTRWPQLDLPLRADCATITNMRLFSRHWALEIGAAEAVLDELEKYPYDRIQSIIAAMPSDWLSAHLREELRSWWLEGGRERRVADVRVGLRNGTLL